MIDENFFNGVSFNEIIGDIQAQYKNTNNEAFLSDIVKLFETYIFGAWKSLFKDNFYLSTASGDALDLWGCILGIDRLIPGNSNDDYNYFNFDKKKFYKLLFFNDLEKDYFAITDDAFRDILLLVYQKQFIGNTNADVNAFLNNFFKQYGSIRVRDSLDMNTSVVYFENIPDFLIYFFKYKDILPRPACLGLMAGTDYNRAFGFETKDVQYNANCVSAFFNSNFTDVAEI